MIDVTVLIMAVDKDHIANNESMKHPKYGLVDVFPTGKLQKQTATFFTVDVAGVPVDTVSEARDLIIQPVFAAPLNVLANEDHPEIIHRSRFVIDMDVATTKELTDLAENRYLDLPWARVYEMFKDVTLG